MRGVIHCGIFAVLLAGLAGMGAPSEASTAEVDGTWSLLIVTEKGECDPAYR